MTRIMPTDRKPVVLLSSLLCFACGDGVAAGALDEASNDNASLSSAISSERIVGGGGTSLAVYEAGNPDGAPIVFIHGFSQNSMSWERQFSGSLADEFRLIAYDMRGHGASDKPLDTSHYTESELWAQDLAGVIRAKKLDRPVLIGWSYGGYVISDYVRKFGDSGLGGLVFVAGVTKNGTEEAAGFLTDEILALFQDVLSPDARASINATRSFTRLFTEAGSDAFEVAYGSAMMVPPEARLGMFSRVLDNDDVLRRITTPSLVIHGTDDRIVRVGASQHIARMVTGARMLTYDGAGHAPHLDTPYRFERDVSEFVRAARRD